jgi:hypothetical protein
LSPQGFFINEKNENQFVNILVSRRSFITGARKLSMQLEDLTLENKSDFYNLNPIEGGRIITPPIPFVGD